MFKAKKIIREVGWDGVKVVVYEDIYGRIRVHPKQWVKVLPCGCEC